MRLRGCALALAVSVALAGAAGCHHAAASDVLPLLDAGMDYDTISQLKALNMTQTEMTQLAQVYQAGISSAGCVALLKQFRSRQAHFDSGDTIAGLMGAGLSENGILELAKLNELGPGAGELQAMRLAGLSDEIVIEVARRHANREPVLSGVSLALLKNTGLRGSTLFTLARRGIPDSDAKAILALRKRGASDAAILKRFSGA